MEKSIHAKEPVRQINGQFNNQVRKIRKIYQVGCSESLIISFFKTSYKLLQSSKEQDVKDCKKKKFQIKLM